MVIYEDAEGLIQGLTVYLNTIIAAFPPHPINRRFNLGFHAMYEFAPALLRS